MSSRRMQVEYRSLAIVPRRTAKIGPRFRVLLTLGASHADLGSADPRWRRNYASADSGVMNTLTGQFITRFLQVRDITPAFNRKL